MPNSQSDAKTAGPTDPTIDAPSPLAKKTPRGKPSHFQYAEKGDSSQELRSETNVVLRGRLRLAAIMLTIAQSVFLLWYLVGYLNSSSPGGLFLLGLHVFVTACLATCAAVLCRSCDFSTIKLRIIELVVFSLPALFLLIWYFDYIAWSAREYRVIPDIEGTWLMLIFVYALFIPNNWRRASIVIGVIGVLPLLLTGLMAAYHPDCKMVDNMSSTFCSQLVLKMIIAVVVAAVAVHTINTLRREVFEARQLGQYRLREKLGSGGMGEVFLAEHQMMKRPCAIKMIRPEKAGDPKTLARFEREVRTTARLSHWNNIDIFDYGRADDGAFYYVMEYLPGKDLKKLVEEFGPMPASRVIFLLRQICDALNEAHGIGLIHRDIKPGNIIAADRGGLHDIAKLLDFGLAKPPLDIESHQLTQEGSVSGSPAYMSPEQVTNDSPADERSDIYSLGTVAYYLLTGQPPFDHLNPMKVMISHVNEQPDSLHVKNPDVPRDLESVVMQCLAKSPDERYATAQELKDALDRCDDAGKWTFAVAAEWWRTHVEHPARTEEEIATTA